MRLPAALLALGFTFSAVVAFGLAYLLGFAVAPLTRRYSAVLMLVEAIILVVCLLIDLGVLPVPRIRRQTPQRFFRVLGAKRGALVWGLDTGLVITTVRVTSLSWAGLAAAILHLVPWWSGLAYAAAFCVPSLVMILLVPGRHGEQPDGHQEPIWLMERIGRMGPTIRRLSFAPYLILTALCAATWVVMG